MLKKVHQIRHEFIVEIQEFSIEGTLQLSKGSNKPKNKFSAYVNLGVLLEKGFEITNERQKKAWKNHRFV